MNKINILIIDDEALLREGLTALLKKEDFVRDVHEASCLRECYEKMAVHRIDLILLDIRLQGASGLEVLTGLKKKRIPPKMIAVTGLEGAEVVIALLKKGIDGIVHKLDGYKEIVAAIKSVMGPHGTYFQEKTIKII